MSDFQDFLFGFESSPGKQRKKKGLKQKMTEKTGKEKRRKMKNTKITTDLELRREKRKKKKKRKKEELEAGFCDSAASSLHQKKKVKPEKPRREKKVWFDLSAHCPALPSPVREEEGDSQGSHVHSQDLFITQKTFRVSPSPTPSQTQPLVEDSPSCLLLHPYVRTSSQPGDQRTEDRADGFLQSEMQPQTYCPAERQQIANPFLDLPILVKSNPAPCRDASTQTENFFTSQLSSFLRFTHSCRAPSQQEEMLLDLSLPDRVRGQDGTTARGAGGKRGSTGGGQATPSSQSGSEIKSGDTAASSEDGELQGRFSILTQVRAVQMRLNESFFFKAKGDAQSPRPESPLMKLAQRRDMKHKKSR